MMSRTRIHAIYCRCPQCAPHHPSAREIGTPLKAAFLVFGMLGALALLSWLGLIVARQLTALF